MLAGLLAAMLISLSNAGLAFAVVASTFVLAIADVRLLGESVRPLAVGQVRSASSVALRSGGLST